jgi:hypothetical protein
MKHSIETIIEVCNSSKSMSQAAKKLEINYKTLKKYSKIIGVFNPNPSGKGISKKNNGNKIPLNEILEGKHPYYQTNKLRIRLINDGIKTSECEIVV